MAEIALVTGGETGIGRAIVAALEAAGFEVETASRRTGYDLTDRAAIDRLIKRLTRLDLLVNNAGVAESAPLARITDESWDRHLAVNVTAPFLLCRAALPLLKAAPRGRIINIASTAGLAGAPYVAAYTASKHALVGLTRSLAQELKDVAVHALCPGFVATELTDRSVANIMAQTGMSEADARTALASQNKSGRLVQPDEVAAAVVKLAQAGDTGQEVVLE